MKLRKNNVMYKIWVHSNHARNTLQVNVAMTFLLSLGMRNAECLQL